MEDGRPRPSVTGQCTTGRTPVLRQDDFGEGKIGPISGHG